MANVKTKEFTTLRRRVSHLTTRFEPDLTSNPLAVDTSNGIASVVRTGVGTFLVKFGDVWKDIIAWGGNLHVHVGSSALVVGFGDQDPDAANGGTVVVYTKLSTSGGLVDIAHAGGEGGSRVSLWFDVAASDPD